MVAFYHCSSRTTIVIVEESPVSGEGRSGEIKGVLGFGRPRPAGDLPDVEAISGGLSTAPEERVPMHTATLADDPIPILRGTEEGRIRRSTKVCRRLERIFNQFSLIQNVITVCVEAFRSQNAEKDDDIAMVPMRCGDDKIHEQLERLNRIVEKLGGCTDYRKEGEDVNAYTSAR